MQPNATRFPVGRYRSGIEFASAHPNSPQTVQVIYDIVEPTLGVRNAAAADGITLLGNYPNPFTSSTTISYTAATEQPVTVTVYNTLGIPVKVIQQDAQPGVNTVPVSGLRPGLYMYVLQTASGAESGIMVSR